MGQSRWLLLVDWVENGIAPGPVVASVIEGNADLLDGWSGERARPLCPYPQVASYVGGDVEAAESFACSE